MLLAAVVAVMTLLVRRDAVAPVWISPGESRSEADAIAGGDARKPETALVAREEVRDVDAHEVIVRVLEEATRDPIAGAELRSRASSDDGTLRTRADGSVAVPRAWLDGPISVVRAGYVRATRFLAMAPSSAEILLARAPVLWGMIDPRLRDANGFSVEVWQGTEKGEVTSAAIPTAGDEYRVEDLAPGEVIVLASAGERLLTVRTATLRRNEATRCDVTSSSACDLDVYLTYEGGVDERSAPCTIVASPWSLHGVDPGAAALKQRILRKASRETRSQGNHATLRGLPFGGYQVEARTPLGTVTGQVSCEGARERMEISIPSRRYEGRAQTRAGVPLGTGTVKLYPYATDLRRLRASSVPLQPDGTFSLCTVHQQAIVIVESDGESGGPRYWGACGADAGNPCTVTVAPLCDVDVRVVDVATGQGIRGCDVLVQRWTSNRGVLFTHELSTADDGTCLLSTMDLEGEDASNALELDPMLRIDRDGYRETSIVVGPDERRAKQVVVPLTPATDVTFWCVDDLGYALPDAIVSTENGGLKWSSMRITDADGRFDLPYFDRSRDLQVWVKAQGSGEDPCRVQWSGEHEAFVIRASRSR